MAIAWLGAGWLGALPLAAAPIVFHLAYRRRRTRLHLPSLMFFRAVEPRLQARRRLRDWLVLALRCAAIACAVLALARPTAAGFGGGGAAAVVIVVDNSASMAMPAGGAGGRARLAVALEGAAALIGGLGGGDRAAIVPAVADAAVPDLGLTGDRARLRGVLDQVRDTEAAARPAAALTRAARLLQASGAARREIHLFTDAQVADWGAPGDGAALPANTAVVVHRVAAADAGADAAIGELRLSDRARLAERPVPLRATLTNPTAREATVTVTLTDDAGRRADKAATVPAHGRVEVALAVPAAPAGERWAQVQLNGDGFAGDDRAFVAFRTGEARIAAFVGDRRDYAALPVALSPAPDGSLTGIVARAVPDVASAIAAKPACIALTWDRAAALDAGGRDALRAWVAAGGRLLIAPRSASGDAPLPALPDWCGVTANAPVRFAKGIALVALHPEADAWRDAVGADGQVALRARVGRAVSLTAGEGARPLLGLADGRAVLVERPLERGAVEVLGVPWSPTWSTLPLAPVALALAQGLALPPAGDDADVARLVAGEPIAGAAGAVSARARAGAALDWQGHDEPPPLARAGVYGVRIGDRALTAAVRSADGEGAPAVVDGDRLPALGAVAHRVVAYTTPESLLSDWRRARTGVDGAPWLIALALIAIALETWLADRPLIRPREARRVETVSPATATIARRADEPAEAVA